MKQLGIDEKKYTLFYEAGLMEKFDFKDVNIEFDDQLGIVEKLPLAIMSQVYFKDNESVSICESGFTRLVPETESMRFDRSINDFDFYSASKVEADYCYCFKFFKKKTSADIYFDSLIIGIKYL